jgi:hypothetical protein
VHLLTKKAKELYMKVPLIGSLMRSLRRVLAA